MRLKGYKQRAAGRLAVPDSIDQYESFFKQNRPLAGIKYALNAIIFIVL
jgi:hypothetical protein